MFLEVVTRTFIGRNPVLLLHCHRSLCALEDNDWHHTIIIDKSAAGVAAANRRLASFEAKGEWIWVLDDDDLCCHPGLIGDIRWLAESENPDAIIAMNRWQGVDIVLPPPEMWRQRPEMGRIGCSCVITRGDIWNEYRTGYTEKYAGDFDYIDGLFEAGLNIAWLDQVVAEIPKINLGHSG